MRILTSNHYIANFTVPPQQSHTIKRVRFVNLGRLWSPALAIAAYPPMQSFDLAHFVNKIPVDLRKNWLVTFESALPRMFPPSEPLRRHLRRQLMAPGCLAIVAMSAWALSSFKRINAGWAGLDTVFPKTHVLHPAIPLMAPSPRTLRSRETIRLIFDESQRLTRIALVFEEAETERTQEFTLRWSGDHGSSFQEIVRQQWNFSPPNSVREVEEFQVDLSGVTALELVIVPDISGGAARASLKSLRLS